MYVYVYVHVYIHVCICVCTCVYSCPPTLGTRIDGCQLLIFLSFSFVLPHFTSIPTLSVCLIHIIYTSTVSIHAYDITTYT